MPRRSFAVASTLLLVFMSGAARTEKRTPVHVTEGIVPPEIVEKARPAYPETAREEAVEGRVILQIVVLEDGSVDAEQVQVLERPEPDPHGFAPAAVEAVKKWKYKPATKDGKPVPVYVTVKVEFARG